MSVTDVPETNTPDEDSLGYTFPTTPSDLRTMPDEEQARLWRRNAFANRHPLSSIVEQEMNTRLIAALKSFNAAAEQALAHAERADIRAGRAYGRAGH